MERIVTAKVLPSRNGIPTKGGQDRKNEASCSENESVKVRPGAGNVSRLSISEGNEIVKMPSNEEISLANISPKSILKFLYLKIGIFSFFALLVKRKIHYSTSHFCFLATPTPKQKSTLKIFIRIMSTEWNWRLIHFRLTEDIFLANLFFFYNFFSSTISFLHRCYTRDTALGRYFLLQQNLYLQSRSVYPSMYGLCCGILPWSQLSKDSY